MKLRDATYDDIGWAITQLADFVADLGYKHSYLFTEDNLRRILAKMVDSHVFIVAEVENELQGMICGEYMHHPYNPSVVMLYEHFWWVPEAYRASGVGGQLLEAFVSTGKECADTIKVSLEHNSGVPDGYMERFGLRLAEKTYILEK